MRQFVRASVSLGEDCTVKLYWGIEKPLWENEKVTTTYTPGAPDGGLRWSNDRFSYPEGSSNQGGGGRGALGGKVVCEPSGSLEYGELGGKGC